MAYSYGFSYFLEPCKREVFEKFQGVFEQQLEELDKFSDKVEEIVIRRDKVSRNFEAYMEDLAKLV